MFLMYVDESGDSGLANSPTRYFVLTGIVIHELRWNEYLDRLIAFRHRMRSHLGMSSRNFNGPANADERGMVFPDQGDVKKVTGILRRMRRYNPVPTHRPQSAGVTAIFG